MLARFNPASEAEIERRRKIAAARTMHGHSLMPNGSPQYRTWTAWCSMRQRCEDPGCKDYQNYGGRGISVCPEWHEYVQFLADMGFVPEGCQLDRIDNDGNYELSNCCWATRQQQCRNRRTSHRLKIDGVERTLAEWAEFSGLPSSTIRMRLTRGDNVDSDLLRPVRKVG